MIYIYFPYQGQQETNYDPITGKITMLQFKNGNLLTTTSYDPSTGKEKFTSTFDWISAKETETEYDPSTGKPTSTSTFDKIGKKTSTTEYDPETGQFTRTTTYDPTIGKPDVTIDYNADGTEKEIIHYDKDGNIVEIYTFSI